MTIRASDVITPMLAAPVVVVFFPPDVADEAGLRDLLGRRVLEGSDFCLVSAAFDVGFAGSVTGLATLLISLPLGLGKTRMRGQQEAFELHFVAGTASIAADIIIRVDRRAVMRRVNSWHAGLRE